MKSNNVPFRFLLRCKTSNLIVRQALAEFIGTLMLILMASGAAAAITLGRQDNVFGGAFASGIGLFLAVLLSATISGGHVNPIVTVGLATVGKFPWKKVPIYVLSQYLGAFVGTAIVYADYYTDIELYDMGHRVAFGTDNSTGQIFTTFPNVNIYNGNAVLDQTISAGILMFAIMALTDKRNIMMPVVAVPILIGFVLTGLIISFGLNCGAALNPARDVSARIFLFFVGYGTDIFSPLNNLYWLLGGLVGPHIGGIVGVWTYLLFIELHHDNYNDMNDDINHSNA